MHHSSVLLTRTIHPTPWSFLRFFHLPKTECSLHITIHSIQCIIHNTNQSYILIDVAIPKERNGFISAFIDSFRRVFVSHYYYYYAVRTP